MRVHHIDLAKRFLATAEGQLYSIDLLIAAVMSRSYSLVEGFIDAFDKWNLVVAAPLLRIQIDSLVRLSYMANAPKSDEVAAYVVGGGEFRKLRDKDNKLLSDRRLIDLATAGSHPWVEGVYQATSGWVHLSPAHTSATWQVKPPADDGDEEAFLTLLGRIPTTPEQIPLTPLEELLGAMIKATEEIFAYAEAWESRKGLPLGEIRDITKGN